MAMENPVSKFGEGSEIGSDHCPSQVSNSPIARRNATEGSGGQRVEFLKLRHYAQQVRGRLLDQQA
jgi:hypothetical protein